MQLTSIVSHECSQESGPSHLEFEIIEQFKIAGLCGYVLPAGNKTFGTYSYIALRAPRIFRGRQFSDSIAGIFANFSNHQFKKAAAGSTFILNILLTSIS